MADIVSEYQAHGLYDPIAATAEDRLALLHWLSARGVTVAQMVEANGRAALAELAGELELTKGGRVCAVDIAAQSGVDLDTVGRVLRATGLPTGDPPEATLPAGMIESFQAYQVGAAVFGDAAVTRFLRVLGTAASAVAEAANWTFLSELEADLVATRAGELALAQANVDAIGMLDVIPTVMETLLRAHVDVAIRRSIAAREARVYDAAVYSIGFVDLVGFTPLSLSLDHAGLAQLIDEFEDRAADAVAHHDGRLVKLIGDAVMFSALTPVDACLIALDLVAAFPEARVRAGGGVASGELMARGGDYFGAVVNVAARIADQAAGGDVLVTADVATAIADSGAPLESRPAGRRNLKGFDEPFELWEIRRSA